MDWRSKGVPEIPVLCCSSSSADPGPRPMEHRIGLYFYSTKLTQHFPSLTCAGWSFQVPTACQSHLHTRAAETRKARPGHHFLRHWSMRIALNALQASPAAFLRRRRTRVHALTRITRSHATMTTGVFRVRMSFSAIKDNCCAQPFLTSQSRPPCAISCSPRGLTRQTSCA